MKLRIIKTFREGILIYNDKNELIFNTWQNMYMGFANADQFEPIQFNGELAKKMCITAKKIVKATKFNCLSEFLNSLEFPIVKRHENVEVYIELPNFCL